MVDPLAADHNPNSESAQRAQRNAYLRSDNHGREFDELQRQGAEGREVWGRQFVGQPPGSSRSVMAAVELALHAEALSADSERCHRYTYAVAEQLFKVTSALGALLRSIFTW